MPASSLAAIAENIYTVDHDQKLAGGVPLPTRMTIVRLSDGALWLHSPVPIDALGSVQYLIAPNLFHHSTGTLLITDLLFNWGPARGFWQRLVFTVMDVNNGLRQSRAWRMVASNRAAAGESLKPLADWPVRRLIPCHGAVIDSIDAATVHAAITRFA